MSCRLGQTVWGLLWQRGETAHALSRLLPSHWYSLLLYLYFSNIFIISILKCLYCYNIYFISLPTWYSYNYYPIYLIYVALCTSINTYLVLSSICSTGGCHWSSYCPTYSNYQCKVSRLQWCNCHQHISANMGQIQFLWEDNFTHWSDWGKEDWASYRYDSQSVMDLEPSGKFHVVYMSQAFTLPDRWLMVWHSTYPCYTKSLCEDLCYYCYICINWVLLPKQFIEGYPHNRWSNV